MAPSKRRCIQIGNVRASVAFFVVSAVNACGCGAQQQEVAKGQTYEFSGVVIAPNSHPAANSIVVATDPDTVDELVHVRTDRDGHFVLRSPVPQVGLSAMSGDHWAFKSRVHSSAQQVELNLSHACIGMTGRIVLDDPPPWPKIEAVRIGGLEESMQGLFGIDVSPDYRFKSCLPAGKYYAVFSPEFVEQVTLFSLPSPSPILLRSASKRAAESLPKASLNIPSQGRGKFIEGLPPSLRVLGLGDTNHGTRDFNEERIQLALDLARAHGFNLVLIEAGYGEVLALDDYIKGKDVSLENAIKSITFWMWNTTIFRDSLILLREYNRTARLDRRISLRGIDVQTIAAAIDDLIVADLAMPDRLVQLLKELKPNQGTRWKEFSLEAREYTRGALERIASDRDTQGLDSLQNRHALSALSILLGVDLLEQSEYLVRIATRDRAMAKLAEELLGLDPRVRATLSAHLLHVARKNDVGSPTLGGILDEKLGPNYQAYALLAYEGAAVARSSVKAPAPITHPLPRTPRYTLESILAMERSTVAGNVTYWNFVHASAEGRYWLQRLHFVRSFGAYYPDAESSFRTYDMGSFDGAILFRRVTPIQLGADRPMSCGLEQCRELCRC